MWPIAEAAVAVAAATERASEAIGQSSRQSVCGQAGWFGVLLMLQQMRSVVVVVVEFAMLSLCR